VRSLAFERHTQVAARPCTLSLAGPMCASCAPNHYRRPNAQCQQCPNQSSQLQARFTTAGPFALILLALFSVIAGTVWVLDVLGGGDRTAAILPALGQSKEFCIWFILCAQFMASSLSSVSAGLPEWIMYLYTLMSFFNFDSSYVSFEGCEASSGSAFVLPLVTLVFCLVLIALQGALACLKVRFAHADRMGTELLHRGMHLAHPQHGIGTVQSLDSTEHPGKPVMVQFGHNPHYYSSFYSVSEAAKLSFGVSSSAGYRGVSSFQGALFLFLSALYPLVSKTCLRFVHCRANGPGESVLASGSARCWSGDHLAVGAMSVVMLPLFVIAMPVYTFAYIRRMIQSTLSGDVRVSPTWSGFVEGDYDRRYFYVRHVGWAVQVLVLALNEFLEPSIGRSGAILLLLLLLLVLITKLKPFAQPQRQLRVCSE
jgi:hypothetical protein